MNEANSIIIQTSRVKTLAEGLQFAYNSDPTLLLLDIKDKKSILSLMGVDTSHSKCFDFIKYKGYDRNGIAKIISDPQKITLVKAKVTKTELTDFPSGFFFGATKNVMDLADSLQEQFEFCFISAVKDHENLIFITGNEIEKRLGSKRVQYQMTLK